MHGSERLHPNPKGPLPDPESYESESCGPKPERPDEVKIGTLRDPVPVTGFAENFSPMPRIAPPPLGNDIDGDFSWFSLDSDAFDLSSVLLSRLKVRHPHSLLKSCPYH